MLCALAGAVAGCAWWREKIGPDTYQVSGAAQLSRGGITRAQEMALAEANKRCDALGKPITVIDIKTRTTFTSTGIAIVIFTCK
jgi:hypothetical protein